MTLSLDLNWCKLMVCVYSIFRKIILFSNDIKDNDDFVLKAVEKNGMALCYAS